MSFKRIEILKKMGKYLVSILGTIFRFVFFLIISIPKLFIHNDLEEAKQEYDVLVTPITDKDNPLLRKEFTKVSLTEEIIEASKENAQVLTNYDKENRVFDLENQDKNEVQNEVSNESNISGIGISAKRDERSEDLKVESLENGSYEKIIEYLQALKRFKKETDKIRNLKFPKNEG